MNTQDYLKIIDDCIAQGPYKDNWESLWGQKTPDWYYRGKLGIFIHWGVYSVPGFGNEWYSRNMYNPNRAEYRHHREHWGDQKTFGYKDFIPHFRGENFDPERWAALISEAGARYVVPVAEHHDGFAMYETAFNRWKATEMGPERDVIGQLKAACEEKGIQVGASLHRAEHYYFMNLGRTIDSDVNDPAYEDFYGPAVFREEFNAENMSPTTETPSAIGPTEEWLTDWMVRTCEFIDNYRPKLIYFDWWIQNHAFKPYLKKIAAYYYNRAVQWGQQVTINYKREAFPPGVATFDVERGALTGISPVPWQTCTAIGKNSWGYTSNNEFKNSRQIICDLIDIVSKNGMMLLNVGPKPDGTFTEEESAVLRDLGNWLKTNGEGIYDSVPWKWFGEGKVNAEEGFFMDGEEKDFTPEDYRFTYRAGCIYAFWLRPQPGTAQIRTLAAKGMYDFLISSVELLGQEEKPDFERTKDALEIRVPEKALGQFPLCFKIRLA